jgi:ATP-dependent Zn protease
VPSSFALQEDMPEKSVKKFTDVKGCDEAIAELAVSC